MDKGTDRALISNKKKYYSWSGIGSEYRASELSSALLFGQLKNSQSIQLKRMNTWNRYHKELSKIDSKKFYLLRNYKDKKSAYHVFPIIFRSLELRNKFIGKMKKQGIACYFHYYPLHLSKFGRQFYRNKLPITENVYNGLVRLPLYPSLTNKEVTMILTMAKKYCV